MIRSFFITLIVAVFLAFPMMVIVWARSEVVTTGYRIAKLIEEREDLQEENVRLKREVERLTSPGRLYRLARERGFKKAQESEVIIVILRQERQK